MDYKVPLIMTPQPEGGYTVTSPLLLELITEGDTIGDTLENVRDALAAVIELARAEATRASRSAGAASGEEAAPAWAMELQREPRAGLREDLAQVLDELTDAKRELPRPKRPATGSPGAGD